MRHLLIFLCFILCHATPGLALNLTLSDNGILKTETLRLFRDLGYKGKQDIFNANGFAQEKFLRPPGKERWEIHDHGVTDKQKKLVFETFRELGFIDEVIPSSSTHFDHVLILGATVNRMRERVFYLKTLLDRGLKFKKIYFLTGDRPLDSALEGESSLYPLSEDQLKLIRKTWKKQGVPPVTETSAARLVWDQVMPDKLPRPEFVNTPMKNAKRPTTTDTIQTWLALKPATGHVLAVSNNPFVTYQHTAILETLLEGRFISKCQFHLLETVGPKADSTRTGYHVALDTLARTLYSETKITGLYHRLCCHGEDSPLEDKIVKEIYEAHRPMLNHQDESHKPFFIALSGTQAMGKSHLSGQLEKRLRATRFSTNIMRSIMIQKEIPATKCHTHQYTKFFMDHHLTKTKNKLLIFDTSVDKTWPKIKSFLYERQIPYFLIRLEIPRSQVMKQLMERNDFGLLWGYMDQYFENHRNLGLSYSDDFDITLNESFFLSERELNGISARIRQKILKSKPDSFDW